MIISSGHINEGRQAQGDDKKINQPNLKTGECLSFRQTIKQRGLQNKKIQYFLRLQRQLKMGGPYPPKSGVVHDKAIDPGGNDEQVRCIQALCPDPVDHIPEDGQIKITDRHAAEILVERVDHCGYGFVKITRINRGKMRINDLLHIQNNRTDAFQIRNKGLMADEIKKKRKAGQENTSQINR